MHVFDIAAEKQILLIKWWLSPQKNKNKHTFGTVVVTKSLGIAHINISLLIPWKKQEKKYVFFPVEICLKWNFLITCMVGSEQIGPSYIENVANTWSSFFQKHVCLFW